MGQIRRDGGEVVLAPVAVAISVQEALSEREKTPRRLSGRERGEKSDSDTARTGEEYSGREQLEKQGYKQGRRRREWEGRNRRERREGGRGFGKVQIGGETMVG